MNFIITRSGDNRVITVVLSGKPVTVSSADEAYAQVEAALKRPDATEEEIQDIIFGKAAKIEKLITDEDDFNLNGGVVTYKGLTLPAVLSERIVSMADEGFDIGPMKRFVENLSQNPSNRVFEQLYGFLEFGKVALTDDGCFLAYKKVRRNYRDIYSGSFDNSVGAKVSVPRVTVDDDPKKTCSRGLHVCSFDYLSEYGGSVQAGYRVMVCKVNPRDVVCIPDDYNHTKMRLCEYTVVGEVSDYVEQGEDVLASAAVLTSDTISGENYEAIY